MAETFGKCTNFASCTLAYRNQPIAYSGNPVCPECGQPLTVNNGAARRSPAVLIGLAIGAAILLGGGLFLFLSRHSSSSPVALQNAGQVQPPSSTPTPDFVPAPPSVAAPEPAPSAAVTAANPPGGTPIDEKGATGSTPEAQPPSPAPPSATPPPQTIAGLMPAPAPGEDADAVTVEKKIDTNTKGGENERVKSEVLKRIDLIPNLSKADKDKLYTRVDRAKGMGKVITVPFAFGARAVGAREVEQLKTALKSPEAADLLKNPTVVIVLLGFADKSGDEKANQKISFDRAENISQTLKDKCGLQNITQPVAMGGSALFDSGNFAKNRVVEVWAVVP